jgi:hypothetical protein
MCKYISTLTLLFACIAISISCNRVNQDAQAARGNGQDQNGYLMSSHSSVLFIQWTQVDKKINGQLQVFSIKGQYEQTSDTSPHPFSGVNDGENISLNFTGSMWTDGLGGRTWTGTIKNNELTLVAPSKDGMLMPLKFKAATVEDYNNAVIILKQQANRINENIRKEREIAAKDESQQQAILERQQAVETANQKVTSLIADLRNQAKDLDRVATVDKVIPQFKRSLEQMQGTVARLKEKAAQTPLTASKLREVESILREVESDKRQVESDVRSMESEIRGIESYIRPVVDNVSRLLSAWEDLKQAAANNSTNTPSTQFSGRDIEQERKTAEDAIDNARKVIERGANQAKLFDNQAQKILDNAKIFVRKLRAVEE